MLAQLSRVLPSLRSQLGGIGVFLTPQSVAATAELLRGAGTATEFGTPELPVGHLHLARAEAASAITYSDRE
jgi:hypothetical protein